MKSERVHSLVTAILISNGVSLLLFILRVIGAGNIGYWYMFWNLLLAWVPVGASYLLIQRLRTHGWREPASIGLSLLWLFFLPNSFYMVSDLIHLEQTGDIGMLFDVVLLVSFIWNGLLAGYLSLFMVHRELMRHRTDKQAHVLIAGVLLLSSFAIYMGRSLRWNSWDVLANPGGLLFDVSERVINPFTYPQAFVTTGTFFLLLGSIYLVVWNLILVLVPKKAR